MTASSQVYQKKRGRDEDWIGGLDLPDAKRNNSGLTLAHDSDLMAFLDKLDDMDNSKERDAVNEVKGEMELNGSVIKSMEDELVLKAQTDYNIESTDYQASTDQMDSIQQGKLNADKNSEASSVTCDVGEFTYYDDVSADLDLFVGHITPDEYVLIMQNYLDGYSVPDIIMYSDAVHGYVESREVSYGSLWEDDIWQLNEHPVIQNDFASPQKEEFGIDGAAFHDI